MKLNIINNAHGSDSKAWYTLSPLQEMYQDKKGIDTMWGLGSQNYNRCLQHKQNSTPWMFCDMPYWNRWDPNNPHDNYAWRIIKDGLHVNKIIDNLPKDKIQHINCKDWKESGDYILVAPSSSTVNTFIGKPKWLEDTINFLKTKTDMPIRVRHKPRKKGRSGPAYADVPLIEDLSKASCVVTSCSMVSVDAVIEGVPVYCDPNCCAAPVGQTIENFGNPNYANNRLSWLSTLSYHQYTKSEIKSGLFAEMFKQMYNI